MIPIHEFRRVLPNTANAASLFFVENVTIPRLSHNTANSAKVFASLKVHSPPLTDDETEQFVAQRNTRGYARQGVGA